MSVTTQVSDAACLESDLFRADRPDPVSELVSLMDRVAVRDGMVQLGALTVPNPVATAEPTNDGYASSGDVSVSAATLSPKIIQTNFRVSRAVNVSIGDLLSESIVIGIAKILEQLAAALWGSGVAPAVTGAYNTASIGSSADMTAPAGVTASVVMTALAASYEGGNRRIVCSPTVRNVLRQLALPSAVSPLMIDEAVDSVPVATTMSGASAKPYRAIIGDLSEIRLAVWGGSVFATRQFYRGNEEFFLEAFVDVGFKRPMRLHRLSQD